MRLGLGTKTNFANAKRLSRTTVTKFFKCQPIQLDSFQRICEELALPWSEIIELSENAELVLSTEEQSSSSIQSSTSDIDALVREVRQRIQPYIQERCGTMRVLDMSQPIGLGDIYTNVNILEKITGRRGLEVAELIRNADPEKFERFCLGDVRERRVPGLKAVEQFSKLMILGKPGAGKTTFLKHLAIQCIGGTFQSDRVPVFITLKDFAEADGKPKLLKYIDQFAISPVGAGLVPARHQEAEHPQEVPLQRIVDAGRALILLDGLDEVRDADSSRVLHQIREFSQQFIQNQFLITCRIAAREYTFEQFTEVEIADFDDEQIADFSDKWFRCKNDPIKAERFLQKLKEDAPIRELATSPLLLTLLCLVFEDSGRFPTNRAELYENGVNVLLKKWDVKRDIERDQVYKRLSLKRKEDLLSQIARTTFEAGNYFFKQREVERYISQYIQNLPDASTDPEALELDSVAVLKSIEAQHGLFVERARGIYSFSHLTFHEYFTARKIVTSCNPYAVDDAMLQKLVNHITEKRWREVILLATGMLDSADALLQLMKAKIDRLIVEDKKLKEFFVWINQKTIPFYSTQFGYKIAAIRTFYLSLVNSFLNFGKQSTYVERRGNNYDIRPYQEDDTIGFDIRVDVDFIYVLDVRLCNAIFVIPNPYIRQLRLDELLFRDLEVFRDYEFFGEPKISEYYISTCNEVIKNCDILNDGWSLALKKNLKIIRGKFFSAYTNKEIEQIRSANVSQEEFINWVNKMRKVMIEYRNIGHDWQFSDEQKERLQQYYDANKLLVDCLNSDCYVSRAVRQEIEETLLLPIAEIQKRQQRG
ncbi:NACHT domain-containing NTPase [Microcoleus sp. AS-A8]